MSSKTVLFLLFMAILAICGLVGFCRYYGFGWNDVIKLSFYENLANPSIRIVRIEPGLRKEQIASNLAGKLGWGETEIDQFENAKLAVNILNPEGYYFPKTYMIPRDATPQLVSSTMFSEYQKESSTIKKSKSTKIINENTALKVASIIQREAAGKSDMRLISGIVWNRIFKGMNLQIDATLQYVKGNEDNWWPPVSPSDKNLESPYNTYKYPLPPTPIASPGIDAIAAAYNPQTTSCLFYLHDKNRQIHCSATYAGHLANIKKYY